MLAAVSYRSEQRETTTKEEASLADKSREVLAGQRLPLLTCGFDRRFGSRLALAHYRVEALASASE